MGRARGVGVLATWVMAGGLMACGGGRPDQDPGVVDSLPSTTDCARSGVDGVTCYPTRGIGDEARPLTTSERIAVGDGYGDRIANLKFVGFGATTTEVPIDTAHGTTVVQLADYFDPKAERYSLIVLNACTRWCSYCNQLADELAAGAASEHARKGVVFIQAITEGFDYAPATTTDIEAFTRDHRASFTVVADPGGRTLAPYTGLPVYPFLIVIDARTMEIVQYERGAPRDWSAYLDTALARVGSRPPKP